MTASEPARCTVAEHEANVASALAPVLAARTPGPSFTAWPTLTAPLVARVHAPGFEASAMDGFAVRAAEVLAAPPGTAFAAQAPVFAEVQEPQVLEVGRVAPIMTGAPLPVGADAVVPIELTNAAEAPRGAALDRVEFTAAALERLYVGRHVRSRGEEYSAGDELLPAGTTLRAAGLALAVSAGADVSRDWPEALAAWLHEVRGGAAPRVGILVTGAELVPLPRGEVTPTTPGFGGVFESNSTMLSALVAGEGLLPDALHVSDDRAECERALLELARRNDVVLTTGGASQGAAEVVRDCLEEGRLPHPRVGTSTFVRVAMQPGSPQGLGALDVLGVANRPVPVVHLPGTPIGAFVGFDRFVRPSLDRWRSAWGAAGLAVSGALAGAQPGQGDLLAESEWRGDGPRLRATYRGPDIEARRGSQQIYRGVASAVPGEPGRLEVRQAHGAHLLGLARANCLFDCPVGSDALVAGSRVGLRWLP
ncbi:molybdopterin molybdotransferase MoeA [Micrococcales bacterium 31B]|nr:molybdopterin molybdotransferase MoeA [Micrococcales bacterium 31B]